MRILAALGGLLAACSVAFGADILPGPAPLPPPAVPLPYNWSGLYVGGNGGFGWASSTTTGSISGGFLDGASGSSSGSGNGGIAGGQLGFNWQINQLVLGVEGDMQWSGQSSTTLTPSCFGFCTFTETAGIDWFGTARARAGIAIDRVLLYGTGGVAWASFTDSLSLSLFGATANIVSLSTTSIGWTAGAGIEVGITPYLSAKLEYLFMDFSNVSASAPINFIGGTVTETATIKDNVVRGGLNVRLPVGP
jgi:outer membrane immunogenic protein